MTMTAAMTFISPNYFAPNSIVAVFLGYTLDAAPDPIILLTRWINLLLTTIAAVAMIGYCLGATDCDVVAITGRVLRTICWLIGWLLTIVLMGSGIGKYSPG